MVCIDSCSATSQDLISSTHWRRPKHERSGLKLDLSHGRSACGDACSAVGNPFLEVRSHFSLVEPLSLGAGDLDGDLASWLVSLVVSASPEVGPLWPTRPPIDWALDY